MGRFATEARRRRLHAAGHEIACHTFSHLDCGQASRDETLADVDRNARRLAGWGAASDQLRLSVRRRRRSPAKRALAGRFTPLRALHHGLIARGADLNQAAGRRDRGADGEAVALRWMDEAAAARPG